MRIIIFEDHSFENFYPISLTRPLWDMRSGLFKFHERLKIIAEKKFKNHNNNFSYFCREPLSLYFNSISNELKANEKLDLNVDVLLLNGLLSDISFVDEEKDVVYSNGKTILAAYLSAETALKNKELIVPEQILKKNLDLKGNVCIKNIRLNFPEYLWQIVLGNGKQIEKDFDLIDEFSHPEEFDNVTFLGDRHRIFIGEETVIDPFTVIDARKGPVYISEKCTINSFSRIEGPCYIGKGCSLLGPKVREGCSIGDFCRIGGEIEGSIFQSYSNKYHDGFIGHAYVGEWVNLGAMTTNSDLKNDYSSVKVSHYGKVIDTNETKVGCVIGDFAKISIGTLINTGSVLGCGSMTVFSGRMSPPFLPDFSWFIKNEIRDIPGIEDFLTSLRIMMNRRNMLLETDMENYIRKIYDESRTLFLQEKKKWNEKLK